MTSYDGRDGRRALLRDAYAKGRGVVVPLPHMAQLGLGRRLGVRDGMPLWTVAERLRPERLYDEFVDYRPRSACEILPLTGGDAAMPRLEEWVRGGGLVCLLADRDLSRSGVEVALCGQPARMPRGPALLARSTGAPLLPVTLHYDGDEHGRHLPRAGAARRGRRRAGADDAGRRRRASPRRSARTRRTGT